MDIQEIAQAPAGKVRALKAPGYLFFLGTSSEPCSAFHTGRINFFGEAPIAPDLFGRITRLSGGLIQVGIILNPGSKVFRTSPAIDSTDSHQFSFFFFGFIVHFEVPLLVPP
jgi:hypothetical protein